MELKTSIKRHGLAAFPIALAATLLFVCTPSYANKLVFAPGQAKVFTPQMAIAGFQRRLHAMGYTDIVLRDANGTITGTAVKGKRKVTLLFRNGRFHINP